jgi:hypothetical protein
MARITWTFDGVSFRVKGSDEYDPWFGHEYTHTYDEVLGGTQSYLDLGSHTRTPLEFRAQFASEATRDAMVLKARRVDGPSGQAFHLDCMFRFRP